jgi:F-type H+-transporting ATPase subunit b
VNEIFEKVSEIIDEGLNSVLTNPDVVLLNIIALILLIVIVRKYFWEKVTVFIDTRQEALIKALADADQERALAQSLQQKATDEYARMKQETQELKDKLMKDAYLQQEELIKHAKEEAKRRLENAQRDIAHEIEQANREIKKSIKTVAFAAAKKIIEREIDETKHEDIIEEMTKVEVNRS